METRHIKANEHENFFITINKIALLNAPLVAFVQIEYTSLCMPITSYKHRACLNRDVNGETLIETKLGFDYNLKLVNGF